MSMSDSASQYPQQGSIDASSPLLKALHHVHPNPKQLKIALALLNHLNSLEWDALGKLLSEDFKHQYFPATIIPLDGREMRGKEQWIGVLKHNFAHGGVFEHITELKIALQFRPPLDIIHAADKVVFQLKCDGMSKSGIKYNNEYMITMHFVGEKIVKMNEFMDSKYTSDFLAALREESKCTPHATGTLYSDSVPVLGNPELIQELLHGIEHDRPELKVDAPRVPLGLFSLIWSRMTWSGTMTGGPTESIIRHQCHCCFLG
ncbi:hypothetical protein B0H17DRAFT_1125080 [Mycena rosella]|uniref:SnoaL-like domain-containing protein n=1 Tax=Mycena rosella TaxID=1033263 RepID=A0AAD7MAJ5_MYCRO|nr:hypothetical protein B0H17DRAFT_1125080 [Mycena rosella]